MWEVPWFNKEHSNISSPFPSSKSSPEASELLNVKLPVQSDTENAHIHSLLFISGTTHWETLLHCQGAFREEGKAHDEESPAPFPPQLQHHCHASQRPFFKAGNHSSKNQVFSDSIHNNTAVSKPCPLKIYEATLEISFSGALCCGASAKGGAGYTHTLSPPSCITQREAPWAAFRGHRVLLTTC